MKKKILLISAIVVIVALVAVATVGALFDMEKPLAVMGSIIGVSDRPGYADANGDGEVNVLDVIHLMKEQISGIVYAESIELDDDNYTLSFDRETKKYTVNLPAGRPPIPQVSATVPEGVNVEIIQGYIADDATSGNAYVVVSKENVESIYTITFVRDKANGFVLQYDDRYEFKPSVDGEYTFTSSNTDALTVDENGLMTAKKVTDESITVTATSADKTETLVIDRIEKAHVNLFFMTGQSNGQGCFDNVSMNGEDEDKNEEARTRYYGYMEQVEEIGQDGRVYSYDVHPRSENVNYLIDKGYLQTGETLQNRFYDLNQLVKQGHFNSLGKEWYEQTGEKVVFLQSAWSGAPIESWLNPDKYSFAGNYGGNNYWKTTKAGYDRLIGILSENYEIIRKGNFWCQGETAMTAYYSKSAANYITSGKAEFNAANLMTAQTYSEYFQFLHNDMVEAYGIEFSGIMMVRNRTSSNRALISSLVTAFFELVNNEDNTIYLATRKFAEIAKKATGTNVEGYGFIDTGDLHYSQIGYNYHGVEAATNVLGAVFASPYTKATDVEIINTNGKDRLANNYEMELEAGTTYQIATLPIPWSSGENVKLTSSDEKVATVTQFGVIRGISAGSATITATAENGASRSIQLTVFGTAPVEYNYRWDFNGTLTSSKDKNDLSLSPLSKNNGDKFEYKTGENGEVMYFCNKASNLNRPDFALEKSFTLDSDSNWTLEWRGSFGGQCLLVGQTIPESLGTTDGTDHNGYIYVWTKEYGTSGKYPIRFVPNEGSTIVLDLTETHISKNKSLNTMKIVYNKDTKKMTLYWLDGSNWTQIAQQSTGTFKMEVSNIFGRLDGAANQNYIGSMDYIDVHIETVAKVTE